MAAGNTAAMFFLRGKEFFHMFNHKSSPRALALLALSWISPASWAANFVVNSNIGGDVSDANQGDGVCDTGGGICSLRAAIQEANANPAFDKITFAPGVTQIVLTNDLPQVIGRVFIDGSTGNAAAPRVVVDGGAGGANQIYSCLNLLSDAGADVEQPIGTTFPAANSRVENLVLQNCNSAGISLTGHGYLVRNNIIGLNAAQTAAAPNDGPGIVVDAQQTQGAIPASFPNVTTAPPATLTTAEGIASYLQTALPSIPPTGIIGNVVSGNLGSGISIVSQYAAATVVYDNKVGVAGDSVTVFSNATSGGAGLHGIAIQAQAYFNFIHGNVVAGNNANPNSSGIFIDATQGFPLPNIVSGNYVGVSPTNPALDLGNALSGITVAASIPLAGVNPLGISNIIGPDNRIGFNRGTAGNDLVNSQEGGIFLNGSDATSSNIRVYGNQIGAVDIGGTWHAVPNASHGINVVGRQHVIGGASAAEGNLIGNNAGHGIVLRGTAGDFGTLVQNNRVGVGPAGEAMGNTGVGIRLWSGGHTVSQNTIANNGSHAIKLSSSNAWSDLITRNSISATAANFLGIDLDGVVDAPDLADTSGAVVDRDSSAQNYANWQQNTAVLSAPTYDTATQMLTVTYSLFSAPNGQYRLELFMNDVARREGRVYLGEAILNTGAAANGWGGATGTLTVAAPADIPGKYVTATVTDLQVTSTPLPPGAAAAVAVDNTSEFSAAVLVPAGPVAAAGQVEFVSATYTAGESAGTATITVRRINGSAGAIGVTYDSVAGGTATIAADYQTATGTVSWADNDTANKTFTVTVLNDTSAEPNETVNLQLSLPTGGAALGPQATSVLTIVDDDAAVPMSLKEVPALDRWAVSMLAGLLALVALLAARRRGTKH